MFDYQGRSYLHIPQDVGVNLRSTEAPDKCYLPKKQIHVWSGHTKVSRGNRSVRRANEASLASTVACEYRRTHHMHA